MGLLSKKTPPPPPPTKPQQPVQTKPTLSQDETIIGKDATVKGDMETKGVVRILGILEGSIQGARQVFIENTGRVKGNIHANKIHVAGQVKGNVLGMEAVELTAQASLEGDIVAEKIKIDAGAKFKGRVDMKRPAPVSEEKPAENAKSTKGGKK